MESMLESRFEGIYSPQLIDYDLIKLLFEFGFVFGFDNESLDIFWKQDSRKSNILFFG